MTNILVVDDSRLVFREVESALGGTYHLEHARDGVEGLSRLMAGDFAVALVDVNMPRMDGIEVVKRARAEGVTTPIVMLTSEARASLVKEARSAGARAWIVKPARPDLIAKVVDKLAESQAA